MSNTDSEYARIFDQMVDDIKAGEILIAEFDTGLTVAMDYEKLSLTDMDEEEGFDIILTGEVLQFLHLLLEAKFVANETDMDLDFDMLLN